MMLDADQNNQAPLENRGDLDGSSPRSIEAQEPADFQFERPDWSLFMSVDTLSQKASVKPALLRRAVLKELVDNALDAGDKKAKDAKSEVKVEVGALDQEGNRFFVRDYGDGIEGGPEDIARLFSINRPMVSTKLWRKPTRGALGNGLRVVVGAVMSSDGALEVWTRNRRYVLVPRHDGTTAVKAEEEIDFPTGTRIQIAFGPDIPRDPNALEWAFNAIDMAQGDVYRGKASPYWYDLNGFRRMLKAAGKRTVRDLVANLEGCTGKAGEIVAACGVKGMACEDLDRDQAIAVLEAARKASNPVPCDRLGKVGSLDGWPHYAREKGTFVTGGREPKAEIPFIVEAWAEVEVDSDPDGNATKVRVFVNRTPIIDDVYGSRDEGKFLLHGCGLYRHIDLPKAAYRIAINVIAPYVPITSDGKRPDLGHFGEAIVSVVTKAARKACKRKPRRAVSIKSAAYEVMEESYLKSSGGGEFPVQVRQVMYVARGPVFEMTGEMLSDKYFTQTLLPDFMMENPELTAKWDVVFDARGNFIEPHTQVKVPLGTLPVRDYLAREASEKLGLTMGGVLFPTSGPRNRFNGVLFIEKEGFEPLFTAAAISNRFDIAVASTKGMSVVAMRSLLDSLQNDGPIPVYVMHDLDPWGRRIFGTLTTDGRRYKYNNDVPIHDLGLRYQDVVAMGLESEPFKLGKTDMEKLQENLRRHHACDDEIAMLIDRRQRVELNAMTSDQFVGFVERRLVELGARKVIPDEETMAEACRRLRVHRRAAEAAERARVEAERDVALADIPPDLVERVRGLLVDNPSWSWDRAVAEVIG